MSSQLNISRHVFRSVSSRFLLSATFLIGLLSTVPALAQTDRQNIFDETKKGGTLRLVASSSGGTLDPQINYAAKYIDLFANIYDGLVGFRKERGSAGNELVADLAASLPEPEDNGRTWTFRLRPDIKFSDGRPVTVEDVAASMRRIFIIGSPTSGAFYSAILGADLCQHDPSQCTLSEGVVTDPQKHTITFHLNKPDAEFLQKLAFTHASILPADTPLHDLGNTPAIGTGPYRIVSYNPDSGMRMERNPYFHVWDQSAQPDGYPDVIEYTFGIENESAVTAVENGQYDLIADPIPLDRLGELGSRFPGQTHIEPHPQAYYAFLNTNIPPFNNQLARQAVNYAMDRRAIAIFYGGRALATPLCSMIPSSVPGADPSCPWSKGASLEQPAEKWLAPDMEKARELVRLSGTAGQKVTVLTSSASIEMAMGMWLQDALRQMGYDASLRTLNPGVFFSYIQNSSNHVQISIKSWAHDYPSPSNFLDSLLGCENFHPGSDSSINISGFCDKEIQKQIDQEKSDTSLSSEQTIELWKKIDKEFQILSPVVPMIEMNSVKLVSPHVKNYFYTTLYEVLFSQLQVK